MTIFLKDFTCVQRLYRKPSPRKHENDHISQRFHLCPKMFSEFYWDEKVATFNGAKSSRDEKELIGNVHTMSTDTKEG